MISLWLVSLLMTVCAYSSMKAGNYPLTLVFSLLAGYLWFLGVAELIFYKIDRLTAVLKNDFGVPKEFELPKKEK